MSHIILYIIHVVKINNLTQPNNIIFFFFFCFYYALSLWSLAINIFDAVAPTNVDCRTIKPFSTLQNFWRLNISHLLSLIMYPKYFVFLFSFCSFLFNFLFNPKLMILCNQNICRTRRYKSISNAFIFSLQSSALTSIKKDTEFIINILAFSSSDLNSTQNTQKIVSCRWNFFWLALFWI